MPYTTLAKFGKNFKFFSHFFQNIFSFYSQFPSHFMYLLSHMIQLSPSTWHFNITNNSMSYDMLNLSLICDFLEISKSKKTWKKEKFIIFKNLIFCIFGLSSRSGYFEVVVKFESDIMIVPDSINLALWQTWMLLGKIIYLAEVNILFSYKIMSVKSNLIIFSPYVKK